MQRSRRAVAEVRYAEHGTVRPEAIALREAFDLAVTGRYMQAADRLQKTVNELNDKQLRGWLKEQKAAYLHFADEALAQKALMGALDENPFVLRPVNGVAATQIKAAAVQAREAAGFLSAKYTDGTNLVLGVKRLLEEVVWGEEERSDDAERAWEQLGAHLGFVSTRPEKQYGKGPDNLWALSASEQAVIELKTGCVTDTIAKKDLNQLGGSVRWLNKINGEVKALPVMLHPSRTCDVQGTPPPGMRVVTPAKFELLREAVTKFANALAASPGSWKDEQAVSVQLTQHKLTGNFFNTYSEAVRTTA